jgi:N-acetylglutamate synthase
MLPLHRLEEISLNASPFLQQVIYDGWLLRFSEGQSQRANGVSVVAQSTLPLEEKIAVCENWYDSKRLPAVFRVTTLTRDHDLDRALESRGYVISERVDTLWRDLRSIAPSDDMAAKPTIKTVVLPFEEWSAHLYRIKSQDESCRSRHAKRMQPIAGNSLCYALSVGSDVAVCAQTVREGAYAGIFNVFASNEHRRKGYAKLLMLSILECERDAGLQTAYLQVAQHNTVAKQLYIALGFSLAYEYWYRVRANS